MAILTAYNGSSTKRDILSALNHANLLAVYDVGEQQSVHYLVSEFLEGQNLRERIGSGVLPARKLTEYALQIANGLAAAHEKGIVHRDLKPDNVFRTKDERVKILDFGLAKQTCAGATASQDGATMTGPTPTTPGTVMGTVGYMSPEQVRGQTVDYRSDIFSLGAILYEMIGGKRAFQCDSSVETMNAILKEDPPELSESSLHMAPGLERIVRRCLEKAPERRFQSASDLAFALETLSGTSQATAAQPAAAPRFKPWVVVFAAALIVVAVAAYFAGTRNSGGPAHFERLTFQRGYIKGANVNSHVVVAWR